MPDQPRGTVAFLFTDIEGSTRLWRDFPAAMPAAYARHDAILREAVAAHDGVVYKVIGDALQIAFATAPAALAAALAAQRALAAEPWDTGGLPEPLRIRMALHAGAVEPDAEGDYRSPVLNRLGRLLSAGHGGQVLLSSAAHELVAEALPDGVSLRDLGEHRLKDLETPSRIHQLQHPDLLDRFPPPRTLERHPHNLPSQLTAFLGREGEVAAVAALLRQEDVRLATLTGPGGTGKTRLSLQVAAQVVDDFPDGVWFVELAPVGEASLVPSAIAQALGVREEAGRALGETLQDSLRGKRLLLVLDNFEHLLAAAPAVGELLAASPLLKVLATSRAPLRLRGERELAVPPLALPDPRHPTSLAQLTQYEAVRLFIARAQDVRADFAVDNDNAPAVAEICVRLDGLPLAIELAAARVKLLPPEALLRRLEQRLPLLTTGTRDVPDRQRTLRGAIAWSFDLLSAPERALFRRLAVFAGGFDFEAAEAVANDDEAIDVLDGLTGLVDHSLVRQTAGADGEPRFAMLETIREYGLESLRAAAEEHAVRAAHADHFLRLVEQAVPKLRQPADPATLDRMETEHPNLRAALAWFRERKDAERALRFAGVMWRFWLADDHWRLAEAEEQLTAVLDLGADAASPVLLARVQAGLGFLLQLHGEERAPMERFREALPAYRADGNPEDLAELLNGLGWVAHGLNNAEALSCFEESLAIARDIGNSWWTAANHHGIGAVAWNGGDFGRARSLLEESLALYRTVGDQNAIASLMDSLGELALEGGDAERATALFEDALTLARVHGGQVSVNGLICGLAKAHMQRGNLDEAAALVEESLVISRELGNPNFVAWALGQLGKVNALAGNVSEAEMLLQQGLALTRTREMPWDVAYMLDGLARVAWARGNRAESEQYCLESLHFYRARQFPPGMVRGIELLAEHASAIGRHEQATRLLAALDEARTGPHATACFRADELVPPSCYDRAVAVARAALDERVFAAAWQAGLGLTLDEAAAEAIEFAAQRHGDSPGGHR